MCSPHAACGIDLAWQSSDGGRPPLLTSKAEESLRKVVQGHLRSLRVRSMPPQVTWNIIKCTCTNNWISLTSNYTRVALHLPVWQRLHFAGKHLLWSAIFSLWSQSLLFACWLLFSLQTFCSASALCEVIWGALSPAGGGFGEPYCIHRRSFLPTGELLHQKGFLFLDIILFQAN